MAATTEKRPFLKRLKEVSDTIAAATVIGGAAVACGTWAVSQIVASTNERIDAMTADMRSIELNTTRTQLLTLMTAYPDDESEILKVAEYYFNDLNGDWYMTPLFARWAEQRGIDVSNIIRAGDHK